MRDTANSRIGKTIADARRHARLTQFELAEILGVGQSMISKLESGERALQAKEIAPFALACNIEPVEFYSRIRTAANADRLGK